MEELAIINETNVPTAEGTYHKFKHLREITSRDCGGVGWKIETNEFLMRGYEDWYGESIDITELTFTK